MNQAELVSQRRQTRAWIKADPSTIVLTRNNRVKTPSGGFKDEPQVLPEQRVKFLWASLGQQFITPTTGGRSQVLRDQLLCLWDADIRPGDTFVWEEDTYEVEEVSDTPYRKIAALVERSKRG